MGVITAMILANQPQAEEIEMETIGLAIGVDGLYLINTDGISYGPLVDTRTLQFWYKVPSTHTTPDGKPMRSIMYQNFSLSADNIHQMATGEAVNLSDWVRVFGRRIEDNYEICRIRLEKGEAAGSVANEDLAPVWAKEIDND